MSDALCMTLTFSLIINKSTTVKINFPAYLPLDEIQFAVTIVLII